MMAQDPNDARWRAMTAHDLDAVHALSREAHPDMPERIEVFAEKLALFPGGCFVLDRGGAVAGYCLSHPWLRETTPALDAPLGALPERPTAYFIHDVALGEAARGRGFGRALIPMLREAARGQGLAWLTLVAIGARVPFWQAAGFAAVADGARQQAAQAKYGADAVAMERAVG